MALNKILLSDGVTELANVKSVVFHEAVNADEDLRPGCVGSASITVEVFNTQANAVAAGDVVYCYQIDKNNNETLLGQFTCEPTIDTKSSYSFTAYDNAQKLNADFSQWLRENQTAFPMTVYQLVSNACTVAGVTLGSSSWGLSTQSVGAFYADGITCRDILSYAAEIGCCFVRCHTNGRIYFDWYSANAKTIGPTIGTNRYAYKQDGLTYANYTTTALARVAVHPSGEDDVAYIYPTSVTSGNTLNIKNNLLLTGADASFYNAVAQRVYTVMSSLGTYRPMTANLFAKENPFRAGDIVSVTDSQGVTFTSVVMDMSTSPSGAILTSTGREVYEDYASDTAKQLVQLASDIVRINKLKVDWAEIETAIIDTLEANGINADWINAGALKVEDAYGNIIFEADVDSHVAQVGGFSSSIFGTLTNIFSDASGRKVFQINSDQSSSIGSDFYQVMCYDANNNLVSYWQLADYISISSLQQYSGVELIYDNVSVGSSSVCLTNNGIYFCTQGDWNVHFATDGSIEFKNATIKQNWITELGVVDLSTAQTVGGTKTFTAIPVVSGTSPGVYAKNTARDDTVAPSSDYSSVGFRLRDKDDANIAIYTDWWGQDGKQGARIIGYRNGVSNALNLLVDASGKKYVALEAVPWRKALGLGTNGALPITIAQGGTGSTTKNFVDLSTDQTVGGFKSFTGLIMIDRSANAVALGNTLQILSFKYKNPDNQVKTAQVIRTYGDTETGTANNAVVILGSNSGTTILGSGESIEPVIDANQSISNTENIYLIADGSINLWTGGNQSTGAVTKAVTIASNGAVSLSSALPIGSGGTGLTASPSMLTNLGSTSAANVLQASPRPGITGTLAIGHGGTGMTSVIGLNSIVTAGSNFQVTSQTEAKWGPIVQLDVAVKCTTAVTVTTGTTVFTVATGYRPALDINFIDSAGARALWRTNGNVTSFKTIAKDATLSFRAVYLTWGT